MTNLEKEWGPMVKQATTDRVIANQSWGYSNDDMGSDYRMSANVTVDDKGNLRLIIDEWSQGTFQHEKKAVLEDVSLGTLWKPKLNAVNSLLTKHSRSYAAYKFHRTWYVMGSGMKKAPLADIVAEEAQKMSPPAGADPKQTEGMKAAIMEKLDDLTPEQVAKIFQAVRGMR